MALVPLGGGKYIETTPKKETKSGNQNNKSGATKGTPAAVAPVVDPYAQYLAQQQSMRAQADAAQAAADATRNTTNRQIFRQIMGAYFNLATDANWIDALFDNAKKYYDQDITGDAAIELLLREENAPKQFKDRFSAYLNTNAKRSAAGMAPEFGSLAEYVATEKAYTNKLKSYGAFADLATQENVKKFIENEVSVDEVANRIDNAYYAINTADQALKEQIKKQFPSLNDDDLARSLVTGSTDSIQQKIKFGAAAIGAEAATAGIQAASDLQELSKQGITREQARTGFQRMAQEQSGIRQAARTFGRQVSQQELEQEAFGMKPSTTAKALRSQARAEFGGGAGITTGSLSRKKQV